MMEMLERYAGKATILQGQRETLIECEVRVERERVWVDEESTLAGMGSWNGEFTIVGGDMPIFADGTLVLPDDRRGSIIVTGIDTAECTALGSTWREFLIVPSSGRFIGNGAAPS